jgi:broad specificity phosphatase PhoE
MRYIELLRHTDNDGDELTPEGVAAAESIGRHGLNPPYALFASTGAQRATQMVEILRRASRQEDAPIEVRPELRSTVEDRWREAAKTAGKGATVEDMRSVDPDLVEKESALLGGALRAVFDALPPDGRALVVGHSPTNEAAVLGLAGTVVPPLGKGEGVLVVEDQGVFEVRPLPGADST